jgi:tetratricopeptide (TPR) repeat protein
VSIGLKIGFTPLPFGESGRIVQFGNIGQQREDCGGVRMMRQELMVRSGRLSSLPIAVALAFLTLIGGQMMVAAREPTPPRFVPAMTPQGNYLAAVVAGTTRDVRSEAQFLREALAADPSSEELQRRGLFAFLANGDMLEASVIAQRILRTNSEQEVTGLARLVLAVRALRERRYGESARLFGEAYEKSARKDPTLAVLKSWAEIGMGRRTEAEKTLQPFAKPPTEALVNYVSGLMAVILRDSRRAEELLKRAYETDKREARVADAYARFLASRGDFAKAGAIYDELEKIVPGQIQIAEARGRVKSGRVPRQLVRSAREGAAEVFFILADIGDNSPAGRMRETIYLQFASYLTPRSSIYTAALGQNFESNGQFERAIDVYRTIPRRSEFHLPTEIRRTRVLQRLERPEEALKVIEGLLRERPKDVDLLRSAALIHRGEKRWKEAIEQYTRAIEAVGVVKPENWDLLFGRAFAYERSKQWPLAEKDFKQVLDILPKAKPGQPFARERAQALNYLAYTWVDQHQNIDQAFDMLKEAVALSEERDGYIIDSLGWAHYRLGQYDLAVRELERAVELRAGDAVINDHLGDAYWKVGREREARFKWNHARDLKPEPEDLKRILDKIANGLQETPKAAEGKKPGNGG